MATLRTFVGSSLLLQQQLLWGKTNLLPLPPRQLMSWLLAQMLTTYFKKTE